MCLICSHPPAVVLGERGPPAGSVWQQPLLHLPGQQGPQWTTGRDLQGHHSYHPGETTDLSGDELGLQRRTRTEQTLVILFVWDTLLRSFCCRKRLSSGNDRTMSATLFPPTGYFLFL